MTLRRARSLDAGTLRAIAVAAAADPRTVAAVLRGEPVRNGVLQRIERALASNGYEPPDRESAERDEPRT